MILPSLEDLTVSVRERDIPNLVFFALPVSIGFLAWLTTALTISISADFSIKESLRRHFGREVMLFRLQGVLLLAVTFALSYGLVTLASNYAPALAPLLVIAAFPAGGFVLVVLTGTVWVGLPVPALWQKRGF